jgi:ribosomal protein S18
MGVEEKPATFINRPLSRAQLRRKFMRKVNKEDVNWRDTAFLTKFMNDTGKILNKYQTRLPSATHRKVARTIKRLRDLELVAHVGMVKPTDKIPVGSFIEDLEEMHRKTIDPVTGRLFMKHSLQDELSAKEQRQAARMEERFSGIETQAEYEADEGADMRSNILREMSLDDSGGRLVPTRAQRQWLIAQAHIAERDGALEQAEKDH